MNEVLDERKREDKMSDKILQNIFSKFYLSSLNGTRTTFQRFSVNTGIKQTRSKKVKK
jgi:hypothetical protein